VKASTVIKVVLALMLTATIATASGPIGIYGVIERVVFEPNDASPERAQVFGAFALVDGGLRNPGAATDVHRGYLYVRLPGASSGIKAEVVRKEWADLKAVAGTGQAVGFGSFGYIGPFQAIRADRPYDNYNDFYPHVRPAAEAPSNAEQYYTNAGIVKLSDTGSHAELVRKLKDAVRAR
jgi:hypothetical protein